MSVSRLNNSLRKMNMGTLGGQSRVVTPVRPPGNPLTSTIPSSSASGDVVTEPVCGAWVPLGTPSEVGFGATAYANAFHPSGNSLYVLSNDTNVNRYSWPDFTELDYFDTSGINLDWVGTGIATNSAGQVFTIGWNGGPAVDRIEIWRWIKTSSWAALRIWNSQTAGISVSVPSPGAGNIPSIQYSPSEDKIYFHVTDSASRSRLYALPASALGSDQTATELWDSDDLGQTGSFDTQITRTSDDHIMWVSYPSGGDARFNSLNIDTQSISFIDWDPGYPPYVELGLAHSPGDPTSVVGVDENSYSSSSDTIGIQVLVPSSVNSATNTSYSELNVGNFPEIRSVAISHAGDKGVFWVARTIVSAGLLYKWECV